MDLDFTEEQQMLRDTVRGVMERYSPIEVVRAMEDDPVGYPEDLWKQLAELGLLGITLPERYGGAGLTLLDAAILYEEFGRALCPSPHFASSVMSAGVLLAAGSQEQKDAWLPKIAAGEAILVPAWLEPDGGFGPEGIGLRAERTGSEIVLNGVKRHVPFASSADRMVVLARSDGGIDLYLVDPKAPGLKLTQQFSLASDTQYKAEFEGVRVAEADRIGEPGQGWQVWHQTMLEGIVLLAAQAAGGAQRALEITVEYAKERKQFDKPLGAFQAIAHYLADASTVVDGATTLVWEAAWAHSTGRSIARLAPMAKLFACRVFRDVTAVCEQVHGGYGFTIDYDIQLYFRRAKQLQMTWWDSRYLEELIAADVLD
ncbi:MAG: acyl-CoA dehydrogenase [Candidatus Dadabacteria bacterium]|nr:MAG: acyl-CoA dehydrogenase [Candidatus Dadabacteria bacterium]